jgi:hypothetical protein
MKQDPEIVQIVSGFALYAAWGMLSSAVLFTYTPVVADGTLFNAAVGIIVAGLMPVALHLYEVHKGETYFSLGTVSLCLFFGGIQVVLLSSFLQFLLVAFGVHSILGLSIENWYWKFPQWMFDA